MVAAVERKSLPDLVSSLTNGTLRYALGELSALPRAAVVVEDHYSQVFKLDRIRPAVVADGLAELQVRWPDVPIVFCETGQLAEEWTLPLPRRRPRLSQHRDGRHHPHRAPEAGLAPTVSDPVEPSARELRAWARANGLTVPDRRRLRPEILTAWRDANTS